MIKLIISDPGNDVGQAAGRAAQRLGIPTNGSGPRQNAREAQVTLWLGETDTPEYKILDKITKQHDRGFLVVIPGQNDTPKQIADILAILEVETLNVTGNRESKSPGIGARAEKFLVNVLKRI